MPNKRIELVIPAPCQQRWQDMKPENAGRFCDSCQKTVVDFTAMTDQQVGAYFLSEPKNVCGRFALSLTPQDDQLVLRTGYVGFISQEIEINSTRKLPLTISLAEDTTTLGEVICIRKPNFLQRLKNRLRASH